MGEIGFSKWIEGYVNGSADECIRDMDTAGDIHEIEEWITEDNDNRSTRI